MPQQSGSGQDTVTTWTWGLRASPVLATLAFAPEWMLAPLAAVSTQARVLGVAAALAALVLLVAGVLSLGDVPGTRSVNDEQPPHRFVARELAGHRAVAVVRWLELVEVVLFLALAGAVVGGALAGVLGLEAGTRWIAAGVVLAVGALHLSRRRVSRGLLAAPSWLFLGILGVLVVTGILNIVEERVVPIAPPPGAAMEAWRELPWTVPFQAFALGGATLMVVAVTLQAGRRKGVGLLAGIHGFLLLVAVVMLVGYGVEVAGGDAALLAGGREVFGPGTPAAAAFQAIVLWLLVAALYLAFLRVAGWGRGPGTARLPGMERVAQRVGLTPAGAGVAALALAAALVVVVLGARPARLAPLWVASLLLWLLPVVLGRLVTRIRDLVRGPDRSASAAGRGLAHAVTTVAAVVALAGALLLLAACTRPVPDKRLDEIRLPDGFRIDVYVDGIDQARQMALGDDGTLYVGTKTLGKVYAVPDRDGDHRGDEVVLLASGLEDSNGIAFRDGDLYVAEQTRILRFPDISGRIQAPPSPEVVTDRIPERGYHQQIYIKFGPDGRLYGAVGSPCDVCPSEHPLFATIVRVEPSGRLEIVAEGVRNSVGFDWHPETGELWFTENARDWMHDDRPPDELNRATGPGLHFGYPHCHGWVPDPSFGQGVDCSRFEPPVLELPAHTAVLGMTFYEGDGFPARYRNRILMAEHGSYNRSERVGFRVTMATPDGDGAPDGDEVPDRGPDGAQDYRVFAEGWLGDDGVVWGRPVDVLVMPDGALLVSDDFGDAIYRISWVGS